MKEYIVRYIIDGVVYSQRIKAETMFSASHQFYNHFPLSTHVTAIQEAAYAGRTT
jgi:hypothetical protein